MTCKVTKVVMIKFTVWGNNSGEVKHKGRWSLKAVPKPGEGQSFLTDTCISVSGGLSYTEAAFRLKYTSKTCLFVCGNFP